MADIAKKRSLGAIDLGQSLRAPTLMVVRACAGQPDGDLFGDPANEFAIGVIERAPRVDSQHQERRRFAMLAQADWQNRGLLSRQWPARDGQRRCALTQFHQEAILRQCGVESPDVLAVAVDDGRMQVVVDFRADAR